MARPRKPTHLKLVTGTAQPCRTNKNEPAPRRERPSCPSHLGDQARVAWGALSVVIDRLGVLTEADGLALEGLCSAYVDMLEARQSLGLPLVYRYTDDVGDIVERVMAEGGERYYWTVGKGGAMRRTRPEVADIADADRRICAWLTKFGLTPADRSRVSAALPNEANAFADLG
jgi:P27 family predicted phage terminase small subunit